MRSGAAAIRAKLCCAHPRNPVSCAASKSVAITFAPDASSCRQNTRPSPPAAPVTTARTASSRIPRGEPRAVQQRAVQQCARHASGARVTCDGW